jgi:hypothetical protein
MDDRLKGVALNFGFDVEEYRLKLEAMVDAGLQKEGSTLVFLCQPQKSIYLQPNSRWVVQLVECRAVWRRRHPRPNNVGGFNGSTQHSRGAYLQQSQRL